VEHGEFEQPTSVEGIDADAKTQCSFLVEQDGKCVYGNRNSLNCIAVLYWRAPQRVLVK
jgi:hypothetical protein